MNIFIVRTMFSIILYRYVLQLRRYNSNSYFISNCFCCFNISLVVVCRSRHCCRHCCCRCYSFFAVTIKELLFSYIFYGILIVHLSPCQFLCASYLYHWFKYIYLHIDHPKEAYDNVTVFLILLAWMMSLDTRNSTNFL